MQIEPRSIDLRNLLAWVLATHPSAEIRNGPESVRLAEDVCLIRKANDGRSWGTLAGAYAETGLFGKAVEAANRSVKLCQRPEDTGKVDRRASNLNII